MICGSCGNDPINGIKDDEDGMCGKCGKDEWIEWRDFFEKDYPYDWNIVKTYLKTTNSSSLGNLLYKVFKGQGWIDEHDAIQDIFKKGIHLR